MQVQVPLTLLSKVILWFSDQVVLYREYFQILLISESFRQGGPLGMLASEPFPANSAKTRKQNSNAKQVKPQLPNKPNLRN